MKELIIRVPDDSVAFVEEFIEKIGGDVAGIKDETTKNKKEKKPKPLDFFGTWRDIDLDPHTYRNKLWLKTPGF